MIDIRETILSQYANSPIICSLIENLNGVIDPRFTINEFYNTVFNLSTASGWGLDVWGRIVGVDRNVDMQNPNLKVFGFKTTPKSNVFQPFNQAPFSGAGSGFSSYQLPDNQYRELIIIKAASNIVYATAPNINKFLRMVFKIYAGSYYKITGHMSAEYVFEFRLNHFFRLIVYTLKLLPQPCGVMISYKEDPKTEYFGFDDTDYKTFNDGVFAK